MKEGDEIKEITVISGKGGTGKTSIIASLAYYLKDCAILADADVTAADLSIIFPPEESESYEYKGMKKAVIDQDTCSKCNLCFESCRFEAISPDFVVNDLRCEGCSLCYHICPESAITMEEKVSGHYYISDTRIGKMVHANLNPGEKSSGLLVAEVRKQAEEQAKNLNKNLVLIDGSPGIGCPVISSLTGTDMVIAVTEPTLSGKHDLERVLLLIKQLNLNCYVIINRSDINENITKEIVKLCKENNMLYTRIPFDPAFVEAMVEKKSIAEIESDEIMVRGIQKTLLNISNLIKEEFLVGA
ncbi:MAG: ATP-binding protein [Candidatus Heimdallarchaeaceae archaeon]|jgi:MinD superfamily P-loop ATPase